MTQRSQFNDRYTEENAPKGVTRKGATSMKPKAKAGGTIYVESTEKTPQQKKAERKAREQAEREKEEKLARVNKGTVDKLTSDKMKNLRRLWWVCLVAAIALTALSWFGREWFPEPVQYVTLVLAYAAIIGALYLDLGKIRKERKRLQQELASQKSKANKAERKARKAAEREALKQAEAEIEAEKAAKEERKAKGGLFGMSKKKAVEAADQVVEAQQAAKAEKANKK